MYELYDTLDGRCIRLFPNRRTMKTWLTSEFAHWYLRSGYSWRRYQRRAY